MPASYPMLEHDIISDVVHHVPRLWLLVHVDHERVDDGVHHSPHLRLSIGASALFIKVVTHLFLSDLSL
jgi:hypothetical protein